MLHSIRRFLTCTGLAWLPSLLAAQQPVTISGAVTSDAGQPLGQVEVSIPALGMGAFTKDDGRYTIVIPGARVSGQAVAVTAYMIWNRPTLPGVARMANPRLTASNPAIVPTSGILNPAATAVR